jgi:hypothetical protein
VFFFKKLFWLNSSLCNDKKEIQCTYIQRKGFLLFVAQNKIDQKKNGQKSPYLDNEFLEGMLKQRLKIFATTFLSEL